MLFRSSRRSPERTRFFPRAGSASVSKPARVRVHHHPAPESSCAIPCPSLLRTIDGLFIRVNLARRTTERPLAPKSVLVQREMESWLAPLDTQWKNQLTKRISNASPGISTSGRARASGRFSRFSGQWQRTAPGLKFRIGRDPGVTGIASGKLTSQD